MNKRIKEWIKNWKGVQGYKKRHSIRARKRKYYCPKCHEQLIVIKKEQIVNSESEEAKNFDFSTGIGGTESGRMIGNIRFIWDMFYCSKCDIEYDIEPFIDDTYHLRKFM